MTPEIRLRAFTDDQSVFEKVFLNNYYRAKNLTDKVVLDVGAHVGFFSLLCVFSNASKVYSVEPFLENFFSLLKNVESYRDKVKPFNLGIADVSGFFSLVHPEFQNKYLDFSNLEPTHADDKRYKDSTYHLSLDQIMSQVEGKIDLVKINTGFAELQSLESSILINEVDYICGVTNEDKDRLGEFLLKMESKGFKDSYLRDGDGEVLFLLAKGKCSDMFDLYVQ